MKVSLTSSAGSIVSSIMDLLPRRDYSVRIFEYRGRRQREKLSYIPLHIKFIQREVRNNDALSGHREGYCPFATFGESKTLIEQITQARIGWNQNQY